MTLPERIVHFREKRGLSQRKLAEILEVDPSTVGHWEGKRRPSVPRNMEALLTALKVTAAQFWSAKGARSSARRAA